MNNETKYRALLVEALKIINYHGWGSKDQPVYDAIKAALAEPHAHAEPTAWLVTEHASEFNDYRTKYRAVFDKPKHGGRSLYLHPPTAQVAELVGALELARNLLISNGASVNDPLGIAAIDAALAKYKEGL